MYVCVCVCKCVKLCMLRSLSGCVCMQALMYDVLIFAILVFPRIYVDVFASDNSILTSFHF